MPFSSEFTDVYEVGIKAACKDAGAYCERVDEQIFVESIIERVYNQIAKADVIIAEMTGRNPNVFYEAGYAHALNKTVILLTQNAEDIPFDLKHYPHIVYDGKIANLKSQLDARVRWCIENPKSSLSSVDINLEFYINGISLTDSHEVSLWYDPKRRGGIATGGYAHPVYTTIDIHNAANNIVDSNSFSFALIMPETIYPEAADFSNSRLPDMRYACNLHLMRPLFPDSWSSLKITLYVEEEVISNTFDAVLKLFTEIGTKNYDFKINFQGRA